jgi:ribosome-binding factor A
MLEKQYIANIADVIAKEAFRLQPVKEMSVKAMIVVESLEEAKVFFDRLKRQGAFED